MDPTYATSSIRNGNNEVYLIKSTNGGQDDRFTKCELNC